jgi:molybdopterin-guanine dinucleotide biosynthesis protein A
VDFDALILAGGRSTRLGGVPKSGLMLDGETLLERTLRAAAGARAVVVVGPDPGNLPPGIVAVREDPAFAGPAAAIAAGLIALGGDTEPGTIPAAAWTLVLACDMPHVGMAVNALLEELEKSRNVDGVIARAADGRLQPLAAVYRTAALNRETATAAARGELRDSPVFQLLARLELRPVPVPVHSTDDVDTWDDAASLGVGRDSPEAGNSLGE